MPGLVETTVELADRASATRTATQRRYAVEALRSYWAHDSDPIHGLPIPSVAAPPREPLPPVLELVALPDWALDLAPPGGLLAPSYLISPGDGPAWSRTDWHSAAFWFLHAVAERAWEDQHGPVHSYSFRLTEFDPRMWQRAWANRIALFLRRWANRAGASEERLGKLPEADIILTHDVDAISKTIPIRLKQSAFCAFNVLRSLRAGLWRQASKKVGAGAKFLFGRTNYWHFDELTTLENDLGVRSFFFVYGGGGGYLRRPRQILFDPMYPANEPRLVDELRRLHKQGWMIGLHQSFDAFQSTDTMLREKNAVEDALDLPLSCCRQHWLRFSWRKTWQAQQAAGLRLDMTLGFNDRAGFRNGAALRFRPLNISAAPTLLELETVPMILMDSHFFDYRPLEREERLQAVQALLDEVRFVRGSASVLWHTHVLASDYGWGESYRDLVHSAVA